MSIIKYKEYFEKIKEEKEVFFEDERFIYVKDEKGVVPLLKPLSLKDRVERLRQIGFPVDVVKRIERGLNKGEENFKKLLKLINLTAKTAVRKGFRQAVREQRIGIEGIAGAGKTTLVAAYLSLLWQYDPYVEAVYLTPFDFQEPELELESWKYIDLVIVDNFDAVRPASNGEYLDLDFETKRRLQKFLFKAFDDGKGFCFISNSDLQKSLTLLGGEPLFDRLTLKVVFNGSKSLRSGNIYGGKKVALGGGR